MPRRLALAPALACLFMPALAQAGAPEIPGTAGIRERAHHIALTVDADGAELRITRTWFNPTPLHAQVELPISLPCPALLDDVQIEARDANGDTHWQAADIITSEAGLDLWTDWLDGPTANVPTALDADTAVLVSHGYGCNAKLELYAIPPGSQRTVAYRVTVPSTYVDGRYQIELPSFAEFGLPPQLELAAGRDPAFELRVDGLALAGHESTPLDGSAAHSFTLVRRDAGRGHVRVLDLDLDALIDRTPAAKAKLAADAAPSGHVITASFDAPREWAALPPVRRVVVLLDVSRSLDPGAREHLQRLAAVVLEQLDAAAKAEIVLVSRDATALYGTFLPARWVANDLRGHTFDVGNGSELGLGLAAARSAFAEPTLEDGADWVLVLSDLTVRTSFSIAHERDAAANSAVRMHLVRMTGASDGFAPAPADDPWTETAREAGGMLWDWSDESDIQALAAELIRPTRLWSPRLELEFADGRHVTEPLADWMPTAEQRTWDSHADRDAALVHAAFVGEVWGQRRAWLASPSESEARRRAGELANDDPYGLGDAALTALGLHAQVISPYSSAWAVAGFDGPPPAQLSGFGMGGFGGSASYGTRCGGAHGHRGVGVYRPIALEQLLADMLARCPDANGRAAFETTGIEIVDVTSSDACVREQLWGLDITPTSLTGRGAFAFDHAAGQLTRYLDLIMPTPNSTTNTISGMK